MAITCLSLVQELGRRMGELVVATAAPSGSVSTLVDATLDQYLPEAVARNLNIWVYGCATTTGGMAQADAANRGVERRAKSYTQSSHTLTLYADMPAAMTTGNYELHYRSQRARKLEALNDAVRLLNLAWYRPFMDEITITATANQWRYAVPNGTLLWSGITDVAIQMAPGLAGYPYADASIWNCHVERDVDSSGNATWYLQFGVMPPPGRIIRVRGAAGYPDLVNESDILAIAPDQSEALGWIYDWAEYRLFQWESNKQPSGQTERLRQSMMDRLQAAKAYMQENAPQRRNIRIAVPGRGDGNYPGGGQTDPLYLAAFSTPGY